MIISASHYAGIAKNRSKGFKRLQVPHRPKLKNKNTSSDLKLGKQHPTFDKIFNKFVLLKFLDAHILFEGKKIKLYFWFAFNEGGN